MACASRTQPFTITVRRAPTALTAGSAGESPQAWGAGLRGGGAGGHDARMDRLTREQRMELARQDGVASVAQLIAWGFDHATLGRRARAGDWQRLHRGVYALHSGPLTWHARARAALLLGGPDAALSHLSAGYLQRMVHAAPRRIEVSVPISISPAATARVVFHRRRPMPFVLRSGLARTYPAETALDLLGLASTTDAAVGWLTEGVRAGAAPHEILEAANGRARLRHRGLVEEIFATRDGTVESAL